MILHVAADLYQIGESIAGADGYEAVRVYVLLNDGCPLIFDTGCHLHRGQTLAELKELVGDQPPCYVFLTHTELPHTGNLRAILAEWPDITVVISTVVLPYSEMPRYVPVEQIQETITGTTVSYCGRDIAFLDGILKDQPASYWLYDVRTGTLFSGDGFGYLHSAEAANLFDDQLEDGVPETWFRRYHEKAFAFLPMANGRLVNDDIDKVFAKRPVNIIAPTHGNAIRGDVPGHVARIKAGILEICGETFSFSY